MVHKGFVSDLDWLGCTYRTGRARPGIYIDKFALDQILEDERAIIVSKGLEIDPYWAAAGGYIDPIPTAGEIIKVKKVRVVPNEKGPAPNRTD